MTAQLSIENLSLDFRTRHGTVRALEDVCLTIEKGEILGLVGESGSGKSVLAYTVMGLSDAAAQVKSGAIRFGGLDMLTASPGVLADTRGREIAMIFQSPRTALNPIRKVGRQIEDVLGRHAALARRDLKKAAMAALARVRIPDPERRYEAYPFELSGGMCQRVMIAMALACEPFLLIADEPTTGLDVTTQAVIMDLIRDMSRRDKMSALLITHALGPAGENSDRIPVMHAGHWVEVAPTAELMTNPAHPYTRKLLASTPTPETRIEDLVAIPGSLPDLRGELPPCRFSKRCERHQAQCDAAPLPWLSLSEAHRVRCRVPA